MSNMSNKLSNTKGPPMTDPTTIRIDDHGDGSRTIWTCQPPADGQRYVPTRVEWSADFTDRTIHEWKQA